ncbi:hypothetical protein EDB83DRAFT_2531664 [Lactarius deliciosus]|nr:hypothetical protein EDB83DRAFT_2531664 [Lactarius deliciosus]
MLVLHFSVVADRRSVKSLYKPILENELLRPPGLAPSMPSLSAIGTSFVHSPSLLVDSPFPPSFLHALLLLYSWDDDDDDDDKELRRRAPRPAALTPAANDGDNNNNMGCRGFSPAPVPSTRSRATCTPYDGDEGEATLLQPPRTVRPWDDNSDNGSDGDKGDNHGAAVALNRVHPYDDGSDSDAVAAAPNSACFDDNSAIEYI